MIAYLVRRILMLVPVFLAVSVVIFSILHFIPGDPIDNLLKIGSSPEARAEMEVRYGLDRPLPVQYGHLAVECPAGRSWHGHCRPPPGGRPDCPGAAAFAGAWRAGAAVLHRGGGGAWCHRRAEPRPLA
jgi:hypothetical protein